MAIENNQRPLVDEALYREIRQRFALPKNAQGRLQYVGLYESKEPVLADKFKALANTISEAYEADLNKVGMSPSAVQKLVKSISRELYSVAWYGYMFAERAKDITWERDMRGSWEKDYAPPTYDPNKKDEGEDCEGAV